MAQRPASLDSVSTASDATLEEWDVDAGELTYPGLDDADAIPLHALHEPDGSLLNIHPTRRFRWGGWLPQDPEHLLAFFGVLFLLFLCVALLPWLAGKSTLPTRTPSPTPGPTTGIGAEGWESSPATVLVGVPAVPAAPVPKSFTSPPP